MPTDEYPLEDFLRDFRALNSKPCTDGDKAAEILAYFALTYGSPVKTASRAVMQMVTGSFLAEHAEMIDQGQMALIDPTGGLLPQELLRATHSLLWPVACDPSNKLPTVEAVLGLAKRFAGGNPRSN